MPRVCLSLRPSTQILKFSPTCRLPFSNSSCLGEIRGTPSPSGSALSASPSSRRSSTGRSASRSSRRSGPRRAETGCPVPALCAPQNWPSRRQARPSAGALRNLSYKNTPPRAQTAERYIAWLQGVLLVIDHRWPQLDGVSLERVDVSLGDAVPAGPGVMMFDPAQLAPYKANLDGAPPSPLPSLTRPFPPATSPHPQTPPTVDPAPSTPTTPRSARRRGPRAGRRLPLGAGRAGRGPRPRGRAPGRREQVLALRRREAAGAHGRAAGGARGEAGGVRGGGAAGERGGGGRGGVPEGPGGVLGGSPSPKPSRTHAHALLPRAGAP